MPAREDPLTPVHKGLRAMIYSLSTRLQTHDFSDAEATRSLAVDLEQDFAVARTAGCILCLLSHHAIDEDTVLFPPTARVGNALVTTLIEEHHDLTRREIALARSAQELIALGSPSDRVAAGARLNQAANGLFAAYVTHMNKEEEQLVPLMQAHFTDPELVGMRSTVIARMPPERVMAMLSWILPSINETELCDFLTSVVRTAPPPLVKGVTDLCAAKVESARWARVRQQVGV